MTQHFHKGKSAVEERLQCPRTFHKPLLPWLKLRIFDLLRDKFLQIVNMTLKSKNSRQEYEEKNSKSLRRKEARFHDIFYVFLWIK